MNARKGLLVALLVYVALDLSLPSMPGAFVFNPDDSVDRAPLYRRRVADEMCRPDVGAGRRLKPMTPDSFDAASIGVLLAEKTLCIDCLSSKAMISRERAEELLSSIGSTLNLTRETDRCDVCATVRVVYRMT